VGQNDKERAISFDTTCNSFAMMSTRWFVPEVYTYMPKRTQHVSAEHCNKLDSHLVAIRPLDTSDVMRIWREAGSNHHLSRQKIQTISIPRFRCLSSTRLRRYACIDVHIPRIHLPVTNNRQLTRPAGQLSSSHEIQNCHPSTRKSPCTEDSTALNSFTDHPQNGQTQKTP